MMNKSQTVEDVVKDAQQKWQKYVIDAPLAERAKDLFDKAVKFDPSIYKGESRAYVPRSESYESPVDVQNRMGKNSESLNDWFGRQRYDAEKNISPDKRGKYSGSFEDVAKQYLSGEGKELYGYLRGKGRDFYDITRIGSADLGDAVAALAVNGKDAALIGSADFEKKVSQLASHYGISTGRAKSYVLAHEFVHASQKGKYFDSPVLAELDVENTLKEYFSSKGDKDLAMIAGDRAANVSRNYGGLSYKSPAKGYASPSLAGKSQGYAKAA